MTGTCSSVIPSCSKIDSFPPNSIPNPIDFLLTFKSTLLELGHILGFTSPFSTITMHPSQSFPKSLGVPFPAGSSDEEEITVTIIEYSSCEAEIGQGGGEFDSGDEISISASIKCESNEDGEISYQIHLIEKNMGSSSWPSGFQNIDGDCDVDITSGSNFGHNCNFRIGTPSDLGKDWEGCIVIVEKGDVKPNMCPNSNKVDLKAVSYTHLTLPTIYSV